MTQKYQPRLSNSSELHQLAVALWEERSPRRHEVADPHALIHELGVQRFELELKNGDLSAAYNETWNVLERYTELYDFAPAAYFTILTNGRIGEANFAAAGLLGIERSRLIGSSIFEFIEASQAAAFQRFLQEAGRMPSHGREVEFGIHRADGVSLHVRLNTMSGEFVPNHGRSVKVAMFDVTDRERARTALLAEKDLVLNGLHSAAVFMLILDPQGNILHINRKGMHLLQYDEEKELLGRNWFSDFLPEPSGKRSREGFMNLLGGMRGEPFRHAAQILCRDGSKRSVSFRDSVIRDDRMQIVGIVSVGEEPARRSRRKMIHRKAEP
jgi:PAS domain S-box-containing protein